jgi:hypothetical protein
LFVSTKRRKAMRKSRAHHTAARSALTSFALPPLRSTFAQEIDMEIERERKVRGFDTKEKRGGKKKKKKEVEQKKKEKYKIDYLFLEIVIHKFYNSYYYFYKILYYKIEYIYCK